MTNTGTTAKTLPAFADVAEMNRGFAEHNLKDAMAKLQDSMKTNIAYALKWHSASVVTAEFELAALTRATKHGVDAMTVFLVDALNETTSGAFDAAIVAARATKARQMLNTYASWLDAQLVLDRLI